MQFLRFAALVLFLLVSGFGQSYTITTFAGGAPRPVLTATSSIGSPDGIAVDSAGNVYFFSLYCIFKIDSKGAITRIAGNYSRGYSGDGGPATDAQLNPPGLSQVGRTQDLGLAVDSAGNVYISDPGCGCVRKISTAGIITTVARQLFQSHVTVDGAGNLYVSEAFGQVQKILPDGTAHTVAGGGPNTSTGDGGPAVGAYLSSAAGVAVDSAGNLYIAEPASHRVRKVSAAGTITTFAGTAAAGYSGDGGPATAAQLSAPTDLAVDAGGNLYINDTDRNYIRKVSPAGIITTVAGNGGWGYGGDGGPAISTTVAAEGLAADGAGNLYVADYGANRIRKISTAGIITTLAGDGTLAYSGDGGPAINAQLSAPGAVIPDHSGNLYIADSGNNRVRKVAADGTITTVAGNGNPGFSGDGGKAVDAQVMPRSGLALDESGNLYIDEGNRIRKVTAGIVSTVAGTVDNGPLGPPFNQFFNTFARDSKGNFYFLNNGIQRLSPDGTVTQLTSTRTQVNGIAIDAQDNVYFSNVATINLIVPGGPVGGSRVLTFPVGEGCQPRVLLGEPTGLAFDRTGNLYYSDYSPSIVRKITPSGAMDTIAGATTNGYGYSGDGGPATSAQLGQTNSLAIDDAGNIYLPDPINNVVRMLKPGPSQPPSVAAVANAASYMTGAVAPGEIVVIYGTRLGPAGVVSCSGASGLADTQLDDTQVSFNGTPARVIYTSSTQVAVVVPYSTAPATAQLSVTYQGQKSASVAVPIVQSAPALFTIDSTGKGQAAAVNQDGNINSPFTPVIPGEFISLYATGEGQTSPGGVDGKPAASPLPRPVLPVTVTIGGKAGEVQYAGGAPGYFAGLMQINARIPAGLRTNSATPVTIQVGNATSQAGVTIAVAVN